MATVHGNLPKKLFFPEQRAKQEAIAHGHFADSVTPTLKDAANVHPDSLAYTATIPKLMPTPTRTATGAGVTAFKASSSGVHFFSDGNTNR
jgi:hypothetical protein